MDEAGEPVAGAMVVVEWGTAPTPEVAIVTGAEGQFQVALPAGEFRLAARSREGGVGTLEVEVEEGAPPLDLEVSLESSDG